ncbi:MAG: hypothetical protein EB084_09860 [Proteobacteria bacterium]|nr:hypothetical protein [Pseudomonadota bacterium]
MTDDALLREKLDRRLIDMLGQPEASSVRIGVIVQTIDGLKDDDRNMLATLGGRLKDDLHIIDAYSAEVALSALPALALSPRVKLISYDAPLKMF